MTTPRRICLVSPSHVAANPRLVKEADALHAAGYEVHVVAGWYFPPLDAHDREIYAAAPWRRTTVFYLTGPRVLWEKARRNLARRRILNTRDPSLRLAIRASHAAVRLLARATAKIDADLYVAHSLAALPAAAAAAQRRNAVLGFDAEDFHSAETEPLASNGPETAAVRKIESTFLPRCRHLTAASPLIAKAYADLYTLAPPRPLLNVFPLAEAPARPITPKSEGVPKLYWFSQTIGPGRGLEQLVVALSQMKTPVDLHLRGIPAPDFPDRLRLIADDKGLRGRIHFLATASAKEMARLAAEYDLGLSLEQTRPLNRDLCLTNKIFTYLLAGVPVALTPTQAQKQLAAELGQAALLLDLDRPQAAAAELDAFFAHAPRRASARAAAWELGQTRFNWDREKEVLLDCVAHALDLRADAATASPRDSAAVLRARK